MERAKRLAIDWSPVEHFRPKSSYWWLTWTWDNLLFACQWCNTKHKRSQFPLRDDALRLAPEEDPPGREDALTIDPAGSVDPRAHIQFVRLASWWQPIPRHGSEYGAATIRVLGLDQPPLRDRYQTHYAQVLAHLIDNVRHAMNEGDRDQVDRCWQQMVATSRPEREFSGFAEDVIEQEFDEVTRRQWRIEL